MPKALGHLWVLLLSCLKPSAEEALARLPSSTQNLPIFLNTTPILPQSYFFHLPLYSHFEKLPLFPPFMLRHPYPLRGFLLCMLLFHTVL